MSCDWQANNCKPLQTTDNKRDRRILGVQSAAQTYHLQPRARWCETGFNHFPEIGLVAQGLQFSLGESKRRHARMGGAQTLLKVGAGGILVAVQQLPYADEKPEVAIRIIS